ncbi:MAG: hypothetical protein A3K03_03900 [Bdellovibrionales bacterium RIFOXYD1_FULL_44_7]|nr:MAG: hypothetical protein A3K03_03900 [Bdellovibrionales bacterium RIFOXYD1_FULL_44_7]
MNAVKKIFSILLATAVVVSLFSCAGKDVDENDPAALYKEAEEEIEDEHYQMALDKFRTVKNKFPYSKYAIDAQMRIADVYFLQESFAEAAQAYESFRDLHPKHERLPYAMYRIGKSYQQDTPGNIARDLTAAQKALDAYQEFIRRFPNTPEATVAKKDISELRKTLAEKELYIGNFYFKRDQPDAARNRFVKLLDAYPETMAAKEAKIKLDKLNKKTPQKPKKKEPDSNAGTE